MFKSDFIDEKYKLSDRDKRTVFYLFNAEESCNFITKKYEYTEFCDLNEQFCPACYSEIAEEIKRDFDELQNHLMASLAKMQKDAFKDEIFHRIFRHKYCNHKYCCECNEKIELKQDYVLVNPDNKQHLFSSVKQNYFVCSCNDFIYLPVVEDNVFLEQRQTSEDNTKILSLDSIKKGYSLLKNPLSRNTNTKIIKVNKNDIQDKIWFLSKHIPTKCKEKHSKLGKSVYDKTGNMIRGYYEIWVELNRSCRILGGLSPSFFSFRFMGDPITQNVVSNIESIYNENPKFLFDYLKRIYREIVIGICNLIDAGTRNDTVSFFFFVNDKNLKKTGIGKKIDALLNTCYKNSRNDYEKLKKLRNKLFAHIDLDYLPTKDADELFSNLENLPIDRQLITKFLEVLSEIFESISKYYNLQIDSKLHEITTPMHSDPLIRDINNLLLKLDIHAVQKYTAHEKIEFDITKEVIEKCHKEKKELDAVKNILKNYARSHNGEIYVIDNKNEIGLDIEQIRVLINKHVTRWILLDDGVQPIYSDDHDINNIYDPLTASLNNSPILKESLNAHNILFRYSDNGDTRIIVEERNAGNPEYQITDELMQWIQDFNADKKVSPITCFIEHRGVDIFASVNARNGTVGIVE
jgi:hypothetical protein